MNNDKNLTTEEIFALALQAHQKNNLDDAQDLYKQVLKKDPKHPSAHNNLGVLHQYLKDYQKAKECYEKAIKINPNYAEAFSNLGTTLNLLGEKKNAISSYEKAIENNPLFINAYYNLGVIHKDSENYQKAKECYEKIIEIDPKFINSHIALGEIFTKLEDHQKAKNSYEKAMEIDPTFLNSHYNLGTISKNLGDHQKAIIHFEKAIEINPHYADAYNNLAVIFSQLGEHQKAINYFEKVIEINPNFKSAYFNLGALFDRLGQEKKAINYYKKAIEIDPINRKAYNNIGVVLNSLGEHQQAISYFEKAIDIDPNNVAAYNNLGTTFRSLDEDDEAAYYYDKALIIEPNSITTLKNFTNSSISNLDNLEKAINLSCKVLKRYHDQYQFIDQSISLFRLKHDFEQAKYISQPRGYWKFFKSKNYEIEGIEKFQKVSDEILSRSENKENENNYDKKIFLNKDEINDLLPFYRSDYTYKTKKISGSCINPNKNWQEVEDKYLNGSNQIIYIDDFLSEEALQELREFCLVSKVWNREYKNKYLGAFSNSGFISPIHLQIAIDLKKQLPKLFGPHRVAKIWGFKYDSKMGKGINVHADAAIHNLNFWITPDEYNNNKNSGGLKVYDTPAPEKWSFEDYNSNKHNIYQFLKDNNANCTNVSYKSNRAVLFNSSYFRETDEIDFKDEYEGRRIANTYLFGSRGVEKK